MKSDAVWRIVVAKTFAASCLYVLNEVTAKLTEGGGTSVEGFLNLNPGPLKNCKGSGRTTANDQFYQLTYIG
jgi:hypothetical protein